MAGFGRRPAERPEQLLRVEPGRDFALKLRYDIDQAGIRRFSRVAVVVCLDLRHRKGFGMRPSVALELNRSVVLAAAGRFRTANLRVFGSVLHGEDMDGSDLDLLVDALPGATLFDLGGLQVELEELLGVTVDLLTPGDLPPKFRDQILAEARPVRTRTVCQITLTIC